MASHFLFFDVWLGQGNVFIALADDMACVDFHVRLVSKSELFYVWYLILVEVF